jgi:signal transduction histidine kinase
MKLFRVSPAIIVISLLCSTLNAKDSTPLDTGRIKEQFNYLIKKSTQYNDYRVVKSASLFALKKHISDTIDDLTSELYNSKTQITQKAKKLDSLNLVLASTQNELAQAIELRDNINIIGISTSKAAYNSIMWTTAIGLLFLASLLFILFKRSNKITRKSKREIEELKNELHENRRRAREREEQVVRKLHDEINRYKKRVYQLEKSTQTPS